MYIISKEGKFILSSCAENAVCELPPPVCIENGAEYSVPFVSEQNGGFLYRDAENEIRLTVEQKTDTLFYLRRSLKNIASESRNIRIAQRVKPLFDTKKYLIPCVNVNGYEFGAGLEPKGLEKDGKRWVFAYDRVSIPACTLTENKEIACALFASNEDAISLESSCSIFRDAQGNLVQELSHPVAELPYTYCSRDRYSDGYETFLTMAPGETVMLGA